MPAASTVTSGNSPVSAACPAHLAPRARSMTGMRAIIAEQTGPGTGGDKCIKKRRAGEARHTFSPHPGHRNFQRVNRPLIGGI